MFCPKCGKELPSGSKFCIACGEKIINKEIFAKSGNATIEDSVNSDKDIKKIKFEPNKHKTEGIYCKKCGKEIKIGDLFCVNCGMPIDITNDLNRNRSGSNDVGENKIQDDNSNFKERKNNKNKKRILILVICALAVILIAVGPGFLKGKFSNNQRNSDENIVQDDSSDQIEETEEEAAAETDTDGIFSSYLEETLIPQFGTLDSEQSGLISVEYEEEEWFSGEGIISANIEDFDQDQSDEMLVIYAEDNSSVEAGTYKCYMEMYELEEGQVCFTSKISFDSYYLNNDMEQYSILFSPVVAERASAYLADTSGHRYIVCEKNQYLQFGDSANSEKWILEYKDNQFTYIGEFIQDSLNGLEFIYYGNKFSDGELVASDAYYSESPDVQGKYADYESALNTYFQQFGMRVIDNRYDIQKGFLESAGDYSKILFTFTNRTIGEDESGGSYECVARIQAPNSIVPEQKSIQEMLCSAPWWVKIDGAYLLLKFTNDGNAWLMGWTPDNPYDFLFYWNEYDQVGSYTIEDDTLIFQSIYSDFNENCTLQAVQFDQISTSLLQENGIGNLFQNISDANDYYGLAFVQTDYQQVDGVVALWFLPADIVYAESVESQGAHDFGDITETEPSSDTTEASSSDAEVSETATESGSFYGIWCYGGKDYSTAANFLSEIQNNGFSDAQIFLTTDWSNLNKEPYYVISCGTYETDAAAKAELENVQQVYPDAYVKYSGQYLGE